MQGGVSEGKREETSPTSQLLCDYLDGGGASEALSTVAGSSNGGNEATTKDPSKHSLPENATREAGYELNLVSKGNPVHLN